LSFVDVERGVDMFQEVNVPCVAVVENMAYIDMEKQNLPPNINTDSMKQAFVEKIQSNLSPLDETTVISLADELMNIVQQQSQPSSLLDSDTNSQLRIFGPGHKDRLSTQWGIEHTFSIPLLQNIAQTGDSGTPFILQYPDSPQADIFYDLASAVVMEVSKIHFSNSKTKPIFSYNEKRHVIEVQNLHSNEATNSKEPENSNKETIIPSDLRKDCKCAECVEEMTGRQLLKKESVKDNIKPINMGPCGNYALSVDWSDGHKSLYPFKKIRTLMQEKSHELSENVAS